MMLEIRWLTPRITHAAALALQEQALAALLAGAAEEPVFLLEHAPVYTIGRTRDTSSLREPAQLAYPVVEINRGGQATYHGPGQLVAYPVVDLRVRGKDLHAYLRTLEEAILRTCGDFGVAASRRDGLTGVWAAERKLASLGVGVRKWIAMHGLALNVTAECLPPFQAITPCGITGVTMTCLADEARRPLSVAEAGSSLAGHLLELLAR
jgi:lipoyl(octanoyl) transferase